MPLANLRSPSVLLLFTIPLALGLAIDLWTKYAAFDALVVSYVEINGKTDVISEEPIKVIPGYLHFTVTTNHGAVFGLGQGQRTIFLIVSVAAIGFLLYLLAASERRQWLHHIVLGMLLAGVLGNMYDRVFYGYVRDMIHILAAWGVFPYVFNVADSLLCVGVAILLLQSVFGGSKQKTNKADGSSFPIDEAKADESPASETRKADATES